MCRLRNIAMRDYQESVTTGQTHRWTDRQTPDKVIPMCRYASQATQKGHSIHEVILNSYVIYKYFSGYMRLPIKSPF